MLGKAENMPEITNPATALVVNWSNLMPNTWFKMCMKGSHYSREQKYSKQHTSGMVPSSIIRWVSNCSALRLATCCSLDVLSFFRNSIRLFSWMDRHCDLMADENQKHSQRTKKKKSRYVGLDFVDEEGTPIYKLSIPLQCFLDSVWNLWPCHNMRPTWYIDKTAR